MNINGLTGVNWFQRLEASLISSTASSAGSADAASASGAAQTDSTTASGPSSGTAGSIAPPQASPFSTDMLATLISAQSGGSLADQAANSLIGALDTSGDGQLSLSEVESALGDDSTSGSSASASNDPIAQAFAKLDTNGDGELSQSELASAMQTMEQDASQGVGMHHHHHHHHETQSADASTSSATTTSSSVDSGSNDATGGVTAAS